jgi:hypothetical protein
MYKPFYFKLQSYYDDKKWWNEEEQEFVDFERATLFSGWISCKYPKPELETLQELPRHEMYHLIPMKVEEIK